MLPIAFAMLLILVVAVAVCLYAAHPHRPAEAPGRSWLGTVVGRTGPDETTDDRAVH